MNVKKLYCELVARGMPFIVWRGADYSVPLDPKANAGMMNAVWPDGYESPLMHLAEHVPGDDAVFKNHLTIWALDWLPTIGIELAQDGSEWVCHRVLEAKRFGTVKQEVSRAPTILEAIEEEVERVAAGAFDRIVGALRDSLPDGFDSAEAVRRVRNGEV